MLVRMVEALVYDEEKIRDELSRLKDDGSSNCSKSTTWIGGHKPSSLSYCWLDAAAGYNLSLDESTNQGRRT